MAQIIGEAARYTTDQSIRVFQRMLMTTMLVIAALGVFEGAFFSISVLQWDRTSWGFLAMGLMGVVGAFYVCRFQSERIDRYERERMNWRKGALGEHAVLNTLESLSDRYFVLNDVRTANGNLDHIVVGPTGLFAIETKNWRGLVTVNEQGKLLTNGVPSTQPCFRPFLGRGMSVLDQVRVLARRDNIYVRAVMVFPKAWVNAPFGSTGKVHCMTDETLCSYIEDLKYSDSLDDNAVAEIVRALEGIARMEVGFAETATAGVIKAKPNQDLPQPAVQGALLEVRSQKSEDPPTPRLRRGRQRASDKIRIIPEAA